MEPCRESGDRPANEKCEIEVTPEMIAAGRNYLYDNALNMITTVVDDDAFIREFFIRMKRAYSREKEEKT